MVNTKKIAPEILSALVNAKLVEQLTWKQLPKRYKELADDTRDWRTLRRYVLDELGGATLPERVSKRLKDQVEGAFETTNAQTLVLHVLVGTYQEWSVLYERHMRSMSVTEADREDEDVNGRLPSPLSDQESKRMDQLRKELVSFFLTGVASSKQAQKPNHLIMQAFGAGVPVNTAPSPDAQIPVWAQPNEASEKKMQELIDLNERHRREGLASRPHQEIPDLDEEG